MNDRYLIDRDGHGIVHIRRKDTRECVACVEGAVFDLIWAMALESRPGDADAHPR